MRSAMPPTGSPNGTPTTAAFLRRWASTTTSASRASSISAGRASRPKTGLDRRSTRSRRVSRADKRTRANRTAQSAPGTSMFYDTAKNDHGLPRDPFKAIVAPRPIGWITSMSANGEINLAPYSFFNAVSDAPPIVLFSSEGPKDSLVFIEQTREFVCNLATYDLRTAVVESSAQFPRGVNEMEQSGLAPAPSRLVRPPRVAASPCALECKLLQIVELNDLDGQPAHRHVAFGQVIGVHIDDRFIKDGRLDTAAMQPIARCGYSDYAVVDKVISIVRPREVPIIKTNAAE